MEPFAELEELLARLDWDLSTQELSMAEGALEDASNLVRAEGRNWTRENAPALAKTITLAAARRYMVNPDGYTQSRAGDETLAWAEQGDNAGTVYLTKGEIKLIHRIVRPSGLHSVPLVAWGPIAAPTPQPVQVPIEDGSKPFPYQAGPEFAE